MQLFKDIFYLFFPDVCLSCNQQLSKNENTICTICRHDFPLANFTNQIDNPIEKKFYGRVPIESASALFIFHKKGKVQQLIHQLKYKNQQEIGTLIGNWLGEELKSSNRFKNIDYIIPVPLHPKKKKLRGYNQLTKFGVTLAKVLNSEYIDNKLIKTYSSETQTKKGIVARWNNVNEQFKIKNEDYFNNKHILLIDDVITTGATLESCANQLLKSKNIKISLALMAFTE
ncbi:ComF family protein [Urechidicola croceus]|uniref:Amidophosphoribosyltransferase n=1 Tax=Urechidicola croceus TaxID=1850246 RepID=A0A1D8P9X7_9FLAO|nr:phosphoribosyltransferase family protein [Urechidicola croceus]AOW21390.1 amidophosphoribosyltransferase [Urechidicola croceus]